MASRPSCQVAGLGTVEYGRAWAFQADLAERVRRGLQPNTLLLLQHPPVYTKGRLSRADHILVSPEELREAGISVYETDRGGQVTFHGPGQLVAYPVINLRDWGGPVKYVRTLERVIIETLADFGLEAAALEGITGVWVGDAKIGAIGVKIRRGVAYHGFSINVATDLSYYNHIVPCGFDGGRVTSVARELGNAVELEQVERSLACHFGRFMGFEMFEAERAATDRSKKEQRHGGLG